MTKVFTAQEMRQRADEEEHLWHDRLTAAMLRQAADAMEREEKREKKYEYAVMYTALNGRRCISPGRAHCMAASKNILSLYKNCENPNIIRRSVGEWEEVK